MSNPKISIVVPVYKSEVYLNQCINSLVNQTLKEIEIILINDGSPDNSGQICEYYASLDSRVKVFHQQNSGALAAVERGIDKAKGVYFMEVDADDWLEYNTCEVAYANACKFDADIVFWSFIKEFNDRTVREKSIFSQDIVFENDKLSWLKLRVMGLVGKELIDPTRTDAISSYWGKLYRMDLVKHNSLLNDKNIENKIKELVSIDIYFVNKMFQATKKVVYVNRFFNHYRQYNPNSLTKNYGLGLWNNFKTLFSLLNELIDFYQLNEEYKLALNNRIALSLINNTLSITSHSNRNQAYQNILHLKKILNDEVYENAINQLHFKYLPIHWKVFFFFAKIKFSFGVYALGLIMQKLR